MYRIYFKNKLISKIVICNDSCLIDFADKADEILELRSYRLAYNIVEFIVMCSKFFYNDFDIRKVGCSNVLS